MKEQDTGDLEEMNNWDLDNPVKSDPVKNRRTVVSVSFPSSAFQLVAAAAEQAGLSTSRFIREAAVAKASPAYVDVVSSWAGGTGLVVAHIDTPCTTFAQPISKPQMDFIDENVSMEISA